MLREWVSCAMFVVGCRVWEEGREVLLVFTVLAVLLQTVPLSSLKPRLVRLPC